MRIVRRLGGFALAVELVGAWLAQHPDVTYAGFLARLGLEDLEALDAIADDPAGELRRHNDQRRLDAVLGPALISLNEAERLAMEFAACLAPDAVSLPWLRELVGGEMPPAVAPATPGHPDPWQTICRRLEQLALLTRVEGQGNNVRREDCGVGWVMGCERRRGVCVELG